MKLPTALTSTAFGFHPVHGADGASHLVLIISAIDPTTTIRPENGAFYDASTALNTPSPEGTYEYDYIGFKQSYYDARLLAGRNGDFSFAAVQHMTISRLGSSGPTTEFTSHPVGAKVHWPMYQLEAWRDGMVVTEPLLPSP